MVVNFLILSFLPAFLAITFPGVSVYLGKDVTQDFAKDYLTNAINTAENDPNQVYNLTVGYLLTKMHYQFYNVNFHNLVVDPSKINLQYNAIDDDITTVIGVFDLELSANFTLNWFGTYKGWATMKFKSATFAIPAEIGVSKSKAKFVFDRMAMTYSDFNIKMKSNNPILTAMGWLEYIWGFEQLFNSLTISKLRNIFSNQNSNIQKYLDNLPYYVNFGDQGLAIDYTPIDIDVTKDSGLQFNLNGDISIPKKKQVYPGKMDSYFPWMITTNTRIMLTDYFFNSFFWGLTTLGDLNYTFSPTNTPSYAKILTTDGLQVLIPGLYSTYGPGKAVSITFSLVPYPTISLYNGSSKIKMTLQADVSVQDAGNSEVLALSFRWNATTRLGLWFSQEGDADYVNYEVYMNMTEFSQYNVTVTNIGAVNLDNLQSALNFAFSSIVSFLDPGFTKNSIMLPIPKYLKISNPIVSIQSRNFQIGGSANFDFN